MEKNLFQDEGFALMGAAFEVHKVLGGGMAEEIYQESLEWELGLRKIPFVSKSGLSVSYKDLVLQKQYFPDLMVSAGILVELKAVSKLLPEHESQLLNYMRITGKSVGYLINFGPIDKVEWKRFLI